MPEPAVLDRVFHALSDPSRRAIVERLAGGDASVSELARPLPMSLAAVVQHVQALEACGIVRSTKTGRVRRCSLDRGVLALAEGWLTQRRDFWSAQLDRLGEVLAEDAVAAPASPTPPAPPAARVAATRSPRKKGSPP